MSRMMSSDQRSPSISTEAFERTPRAASGDGLFPYHFGKVANFACLLQASLAKLGMLGQKVSDA